MALDNLLDVELVLADGRIVTASADQHPDLFWAVRGGGGNFGVASSFGFRLHEVGPMVHGGLVAWTADRARDVLRLYRDLAAQASDDLMLVAAVLTGPDGVTKLVGIVAGYFGPAADADAALAPGDDAANTKWARDTYAALTPFVGPSRYVNYLDHDDVGDPALAAAYGPNLARLRTVKSKYDPDNVFHLNVNIPPTGK